MHMPRPLAWVVLFCIVAIVGVFLAGWFISSMS
jgi:hypothetical protein